MRHNLPEFIIVGWVRAAHGMVGELRVEIASDAPNRFSPGSVLHIGKRPLQIEEARHHRGHVLLKVEGVTSRDQAEALQGTPLEVMATEVMPLPKGAYYHFQILGMRVWTAEGLDLGDVTEILTTGSNDVYVVRKDNVEVLVPALSDIIHKINIDKGIIVVSMPPTIY